MTLVVEATGLRKRYGSVPALDGLDLAVEEGHVVGLLGPNGAGKTTALRILVGLVRADAGTVSIAGEPVGLGWVAGERVGAMVATPVLYPHLSGAASPTRMPGSRPPWTSSTSVGSAGERQRAIRPACGSVSGSPLRSWPTPRS